MGWSHPDISLEDLLKLIKGFVDILILASGYQSSGVHAHWDAQNIRKAFQWGLFFENVYRRLSSLEDFQDSMKELDAALSEIASDPFLPQGLAHLSSVSLSRARDFVLEHLIHTMPLRDAHLRAFLNATIEMDLDELCETEYDCLHVYLDKLRLLNTSTNLLPERSFIKDSMITSPDVVLNMSTKKCTKGGFTNLTVQELMKRQLAVSCASSAESGLDIISKVIRRSNWNESGNNIPKKQLKNATDPLIEGQSVEFVTWNCWISKNMSYLLDKRTVRLVSGASMIFSAPKIQWVQVFEQLNISSESSSDDFGETIELLLLGCIASRWSHIVEYFMSVPFDSVTVSKQYHEVRNIFLERSQTLHHKEDIMNSRESGILEYAAALLGGQLRQLWKLSPALAAVAIPSWSPLFGLYLSEIETQLKGEASAIRCCSCTPERKEHKECELAERIWCLYVFHVCGSHLMLGAGSA